MIVGRALTHQSSLFYTIFLLLFHCVVSVLDNAPHSLLANSELTVVRKYKLSHKWNSSLFLLKKALFAKFSAVAKDPAGRILS